MNQGRITGVILALLLSTVAYAESFPAVPGQYIVKLKRGAAIASLSTMEQSLGAKILERVSIKSKIFLVERPVVETEDSAVATLTNNPMVEYAEPNYIYSINSGTNSLPNDPDLGKLWGLINTGQTVSGDAGSITGTAGIDINMREAWKIETGSQEVVVAVIDTGVDWKNPDLANNIYTNLAEAKGVAGVDDDKNGCIDDVHGCDFSSNDGDPMDEHGHGTHVSGTIAAQGNNAKGVVGVAFNTTILPIRFLNAQGRGDLANAVKCIEYATAMKVNIMSNSWGGGAFSQALLDSIQHAKDAGILFVAAAGNESNNNDKNPAYPASYALDNVISVAAINGRGQMASFSNYGATSVHIAAPGVNIYSYKLSGIGAWSGTSMACPHVSGVAALLFAQDKAQGYLAVKNRILASARPLTSLRGKVATGMLNAYYALTNKKAPVDQNDPSPWQKTTESVSTKHPYADNAEQTFTLSVPGASRIAVHFSRFATEDQYDVVTFTDKNGNVVGELSGNLGEVFGPTVEGDTVTVTLKADYSVSEYGFDIDGVFYE